MVEAKENSVYYLSDKFGIWFQCREVNLKPVKRMSRSVILCQRSNYPISLQCFRKWDNKSIKYMKQKNEGRFLFYKKKRRWSRVTACIWSVKFIPPPHWGKRNLRAKSIWLFSILFSYSSLNELGSKFCISLYLKGKRNA